MRTSMPHRKVLLSSIKTLTFYADELTASRRTSPIRLSLTFFPLYGLMRFSSITMRGQTVQLVPTRSRAMH